MGQIDAYADDSVVRQVTQWHVDNGRSILQMFQFSNNEQEHSVHLLNKLSLRQNATVISFGSGVAGMEHYWQLARPDLRFELVNISAAQLELSLCQGKKVCADAVEYVSDEKFDCVVVAYMLGHTGTEAMLQNAINHLKPGGKLLVSDVFNCSNRFNTTMKYEAPTGEEVMRVLAANKLAAVPVADNLMLINWMQEQLPWIAAETTPGVFIVEKPKLTTALHFSGGKDSLVLLHMMKPYWNELVVYFCNTGDAYPETEAMMAKVKAMVPHFVEVQGKRKEVETEFGWSTDILPAMQRR